MTPSEQKSAEIVTDLAKMDRSALVVRHNRIIESRHNLSLTERRFLLWIISQIKKEDKTFKTYRVSVKHWEEFCGLKPTDNPYKAAMALVDKLTTRNVAILDEKSQRYTTRPWFLRATYAYGEGYIEVRLNDDLQELFLELSREYTAISLEYALLLNSAYAGRIYDLLKQYATIGERIIALADLRAMLELQEKYPLFADLRRNVLQVAEREINAKTDLRFDWKPVKEGRKVVAVHFSISTNKPTVTLESPEAQSPAIKRLLERLIGHGIKYARARNLVADYDAERIAWHINYVEAEVKSGRNIENLAGFLCSAIKDDYRTQKSLFQEQHEQDIAERKAERKRQASIDDAVERINDAVKRENRRRVREKIKEFSDEERAAFDAWFVSELSNGTAVDEMALKAFEQNGTKDPLALVSYEMKVRERFPEISLSAREYAEKEKAHPEVIAALKG